MTTYELFGLGDPDKGLFDIMVCLHIMGNAELI